MAAFILQLFHKFEKKIAKGACNIPCKRSSEGTETQPVLMEMQNSSNYQATSQSSQGQNNRLLPQVIYMCFF